jgi:hypothetical protein
MTKTEPDGEALQTSKDMRGVVHVPIGKRIAVGWDKESKKPITTGGYRVARPAESLCPRPFRYLPLLLIRFCGGTDCLEHSVSLCLSLQTRTCAQPLA